MILHYLKAKIHRATVTDANLDNEGSITIGRELLEASGIRQFEQVQIYNVTNGERFTTYAIEGDSGTVCINGAAAWKARPNDVVIIAACCLVDEKDLATYRPNLVYVDGKNQLKAVAHDMKAHG